MTSTPFCSLKSRPLLAIGNNAQLRQFNYNTLFNPRQTSALECSNSYSRSKCRSQASSEGHMLNLKACWLYRMNKLTFHHWYLTFLLIFFLTIWLHLMVLIFTKLKREFTLEWCSGETILSQSCYQTFVSLLYIRKCLPLLVKHRDCWALQVRKGKLNQHTSLVHRG